MKCEKKDCGKERTCFHYCHEHHQEICMAGIEFLSRPTQLAPDALKPAPRKKPYRKRAWRIEKRSAKRAGKA
jgi:hypothetical protein